MRHQRAGRQFNRDTNARKAMFLNLAKSLIEHEQIKTTLPKAKDLRSVVEKMVTKAKIDSVSNRRLIASELGNDMASVRKLFSVLGPRYATRAGGYTRVLKAGFRYGDTAPMAIIEFVGRDVAAKGAKQKSAKAEKAVDKAGKPVVDKAARTDKPVKTPVVKPDTKASAAKAAKGAKSVAVKRRATGK